MIRFAAEKTLGKLTKWLRILGFDTLFVEDVLNSRFIGSGKKRRILLTRTNRIREINESDELIFLKSNDPFEQLKEVMKILNIDKSNIRPFSRCIKCNTLIKPVEKISVQGKVPDYIWETNDTFQVCTRCSQIFWSGSHTKRTTEMINSLFN